MKLSKSGFQLRYQGGLIRFVSKIVIVWCALCFNSHNPPPVFSYFFKHLSYGLFFMLIPATGSGHEWLCTSVSGTEEADFSLTHQGSFKTLVFQTRSLTLSKGAQLGNGWFRNLSRSTQLWTCFAALSRYLQVWVLAYSGLLLGFYFLFFHNKVKLIVSKPSMVFLPEICLGIRLSKLLRQTSHPSFLPLFTGLKDFWS